MKKLLLSTLLMLCSIYGFAYDCMIDGIYYNLDKTNQTASVTYRNTFYNSYNGVVQIPDEMTYEGTTYSVTSIGYRAFL